jgi:hypothetical protein
VPTAVGGREKGEGRMRIRTKEGGREKERVAIYRQSIRLRLPFVSIYGKKLENCFN